ncbi:hypothetical protein [Phormidesmis sp. 146-33]
MKSLRGFEVTSPCEEKVQSFLESIDAIDISIEWGWNTVIIGHEDDPDEFQGFGYTTLSSEELSQFANLLNVELIYVDEPLEAETVQSLGLLKYIEEAE